SAADGRALSCGRVGSPGGGGGRPVADGRPGGPRRTADRSRITAAVRPAEPGGRRERKGYARPGLVEGEQRFVKEVGSGSCSCAVGEDGFFPRRKSCMFFTLPTAHPPPT